MRAAVGSLRCHALCVSIRDAFHPNQRQLDEECRTNSLARLDPNAASHPTRIANVRPVAPGWTWPQNPEKHVSSGSQAEARSTDPLDVELKRQTADIVSLGDAVNKWRDADKLANLYAQVFASAAEAHELMAPFNAYSRGWGKRFGRITKDEEIDGLGDEAWLLRTETSGTEVTYHWRRGNLVVEAHVDCFASCPGDLDAAARAWVDAIDEAARPGS